MEATCSLALVWLLSLQPPVQVRSGGADAVPTLHPIQDLNVKAAGVESALQKMKELDAQLQGNELMKQEGTKEAKLFRHLQDLAIERGGLQVRLPLLLRPLAYARKHARLVQGACI